MPLRCFLRRKDNHELSNLTGQTKNLAFVADNKRNFKSGYSQRFIGVGRSYSGNNNNDSENATNSGSAGARFKKGGNYFCTRAKSLDITLTSTSKFMGTLLILKVSETKILL